MQVISGRKLNLKDIGSQRKEAGLLYLYIMVQSDLSRLEGQGERRAANIWLGAFGPQSVNSSLPL